MFSYLTVMKGITGKKDSFATIMRMKEIFNIDGDRTGCGNGFLSWD
jgi:hypothetical protein